MTRRVLEVNGHTVVVNDPDRRLHGDVGPTKADLVSYYLKVAVRIVPFLCDRPVSTIFVPDGSTQEFRFLRTAPAGCLGRFPTCRLPSRAESYLTVADSGTLAALVDYGCLSFHPWNSTVAARLRPNQIVFNLDRQAIAFREVRNAALLLRDLLAEYGLRAWVKTSGGQGLHVLVPIADAASFDDAAVVAETIVRRAVRREPTLFSRDQRPGRRHGRILIDTSRNEPGATIIAPYAVATSGLVSALLEWDEVKRPVYPEDFDMDRMLEREKADLRNQAGFFAVRQSLEPLKRCRRSRRAGVSIRPFVHGHTQWLLGGIPAAVIEETRWLRAQSKRLRNEAQVTHIESVSIRHRAQKAREELRRLQGGPTASQ